MKLKNSTVLVTLLSLFACCNFAAALAQAAQPITVPTIKETLIYLASDAQEGRGVGTPGLDRAAQYVSDRFAILHLQPLPGMKDYFQPFTMTVGSKIDPATRLATRDKKFEIARDFSPMGVTGEGTFDAPAVFVGYGITNKEEKYDDYAGIDVHGKVAIALRYEPHNNKGKSRFTNDDWSPSASLYTKVKTAADHGAVALIIVTPPIHHDDDTLTPFVTQMRGQSGSIPALQLKQPIVIDLFKQAGAPDLATLQKQIDTTGKPASRNLGDVGLAGTVKIQKQTAHVKNVMAYLPGAGPHKDEFIIVGAHVDHLGRGGLVPGSRGGKEIFHGADDNASGTSAMLELAHRATQEAPHDRSILFMAFTGEEEGLIGSEYFVDHPPVPLEKIAYMLNLDMVGRLKEHTLYMGGEGTATTLEPIVKKDDKGLGLQIKSIGKGGMGPSDHMTFALKKIPVLFLFTGLHADYHRPTDTWDKINFAGIDEVVELGDRVMDDLAQAPRAQYVSASDANYGAIGAGGARVTLGVIPDYVDDAALSGLKINGTMPDSPAAKAGLQAGDVIVQFGEKVIGNIYDLSAALAEGKTNQQVTLKILRNKQPLELKATLIARKS